MLSAVDQAIAIDPGLIERTIGGRSFERGHAYGAPICVVPASSACTHRIGQTRQVMVYRLISHNTIEEKVLALARRKAALFSGVMDEGDLFAGAITAEDVRSLLE